MPPVQLENRKERKEREEIENTPCATCFFPEVFGALWGITPACPFPRPAAAVRRGEGELRRV